MPDAAYIEVQVGGHRGYGRQGVALVDAADAKAVNAYRWSMSDGYVVRKVHVGGKRLKVYLHRELLGLTPGDGHHVDHISGDKLDNRRVNLRACTQAQNQQNYHDRPYRGVSWHAQNSRWQARVELDGKAHYLGYFDTREDAAAVAAAFRRSHMPYSSDASRVDWSS